MEGEKKEFKILGLVDKLFDSSLGVKGLLACALRHVATQGRGDTEVLLLSNISTALFPVKVGPG
jgi:hypothetical protein